MGAVASLSLLASCSSDDDLSTGGKSDLEQIKIGMGVQASVGTTKGTGTVGGVGEGNSNWAGQKINIYMFNKGTLDVAQFDGQDIYNNAEFNAPTSESTGFATDATHAVKYYPAQASFDFWGYRLDDAAKGNPATEEGKQVIGFELDGSQDIMVGKAEPTAENLEKCAEEKIYSAYAARRDVQPNIIFKHLLSRLVFTIQGGNEAACNEDTGVKVTAIKVKSKYTGKLIVAYTEAAGVTDYTDQLVPNEEVTDLVLKKRAEGVTDGNNDLVDLEAKNPEWDPETKKGKQTSIGEAILAVPADSYDLTIDLKQKVKTQTEPEGFAEKTFSYNDVIELADGAFKAGTSYNVNITVFGLNEIKINTTLTPWEDGGNINMNPEDDGTLNETPAPAETYEFEEVTEGIENAVATEYADLTALQAADLADATTLGKIYRVGADADSYKYYKVIKKAATPAPTPATYEFKEYTFQEGDTVAGTYDTKEEFEAAVNAGNVTEGIYKAGTEYYEVTKKTV